MVFIIMDSKEHDVKVLDKILNSELFLDKYPMVNRVWVYLQYGNKIDIVMNVKEPADDYWPVKEEISSFIWDIAKMAGVTTRFNIYP